MKERPILMTPENAQKCHDGTKTQTRRIVKYNPILGEPSEWCQKTEEPEFLRIIGDYRRFCPYGGVGDRLWVREALCRNGSVMTYLDGSPVMQGDLAMPSWCERKTIPSIHMPRWACRTVLEITEVRVERLQDISANDCAAEGVAVGGEEEGHDWHYMMLWDSINGDGSWDMNPWVWVIAFKKVGGEIAGRVRVVE